MSKKTITFVQDDEGDYVYVPTTDDAPRKPPASSLCAFHPDDRYRRLPDPEPLNEVVFTPTGEFRKPRKGEWFVDGLSCHVRAADDYVYATRAIYTRTERPADLPPEVILFRRKRRYEHDTAGNSFTWLVQDGWVYEQEDAT